MPTNIIEFSEDMMDRIRLYAQADPNKIVTVFGPKKITRRDMIKEIDSGSKIGMLYYSAISGVIRARDDKGLRPDYRP